MRTHCIAILALLLLLISGCSEKREARLEAARKEIHNTAHEMSKEGKYREAYKYLETGIKESQRDWVYYFYHGLYLQLENPIYNLQRSTADYLKAHELNPDEYRPAVFLGAAYNVTDDYESAILYLEKAVKLFDTSQPEGHPYDSLASAYYNSGDYYKAFEANTKAIEFEPDDAWNYLDKGLILSHLEGLEPLIENYQRAVEMDPDEIEFPKYYGNRLIEMGYDELAVEHFNSFLAEDENASWCYADLGYIKMAQGDWERGKELLDKAESIGSNDRITHMYLAFYHYFRGKIGRAYDYYVDYRLTWEKNTLIHKPKSVKEFEEFFANVRLFQRLQKVNSEQEAGS